LLDVVGGLPNPMSMVVDSVNLYYTVDYTGTSSVVTQPISGGKSSLLQPRMQPFGIAVDGRNIYWTEASTNSGSVRKAPIGGTTIEELSVNQPGPHALAVDATGVFWTNMDSGSVMRTGLSGGTALSLAGGQTQPSAIAVDANSIYWLNTGADGSVMKLAK